MERTTDGTSTVPSATRTGDGGASRRPDVPRSVDPIRVTDLGPFTLGSGVRIPDLHLAWRHDGPAAPAPQVLVVHALKIGRAHV